MENHHEQTPGDVTPASFYTGPLPDRSVREAYDPFNGQDPAVLLASLLGEDTPAPQARRRLAPLCFGLAFFLLGLCAMAARGLALAPAPQAAGTPAAAKDAQEAREAASVPGVSHAQAVTQPIPAQEPPAALPIVVTSDAASAYVRTAILVEGKNRGVLVSREAAQALLDEIAAHYENEIRQAYDVSGELVMHIDEAIALEAAPDTPEAELLTSEAMFTKLTQGRYALTVMGTETRSEVETEPYETETEKDKYLLAGSSIVTAPGRNGVLVTDTVITYKNGVKKKEKTGEQFTVQTREDRLVRVGSQKIKEGEPGKREGKKGRETGLTFITPLSDGKIISNYGQRDGVLHLGLDYSSEAENAAVLAACGGTVVCAMERGGYGLMVEIDHGDGFVTRYAHLASAGVQLGQAVAAGEPIGVMGQSGNAREPHLHFELRIDGEAYNPRYYL